MSAHAFRRHLRAGRAALLLFGAVVLPVLLLEAILRIAPAFASAPVQFLADRSRLFKALRVWLATRSRARLDEDRPGSADPMAGALTIDDETLRERVGANLRAVAGTIRASGATPIFEREQASLRDLKLLIPSDGHPFPAGNDLMARSVADALIEELRGVIPASPSAPADAAPVIRPIELSVAADSPSTLLVHAPPHRAFQVVLSRTQAPPLRLQRCQLDLGDDEIVRLSSKLPSLRGVTDDAGRARVDLPKDALRSFEPGPDGLRAAALLFDPRSPAHANVRIWAEACSDVVLLRPAAQPEK